MHHAPNQLGVERDKRSVNLWWVAKEGTIGSIWEAIGGKHIGVWAKREETIKEQGGGVTDQK